MILPNLHDRLLLIGTIAGAAGVVLLRRLDHSGRSIATVLTAAGIILVLSGVVLKIVRER